MCSERHAFHQSSAVVIVLVAEAPRVVHCADRYPANLFRSQPAPEQALAGLFRKLKGYFFLVVFDAGFFRSRRVAESAALNG